MKIKARLGLLSVLFTLLIIPAAFAQLGEMIAEFAWAMAVLGILFLGINVVLIAYCKKLGISPRWSYIAIGFLMLFMILSMANAYIYISPWIASTSLAMLFFGLGAFIIQIVAARTLGYAISHPEEAEYIEERAMDKEFGIRGKRGRWAKHIEKEKREAAEARRKEKKQRRKFWAFCATNPEVIRFFGGNEGMQKLGGAFNRALLAVEHDEELVEKMEGAEKFLGIIGPQMENYTYQRHAKELMHYMRQHMVELEKKDIGEINEIILRLEQFAAAEHEVVDMKIPEEASEEEKARMRERKKNAITGIKHIHHEIYNLKNILQKEEKLTVDMEEHMRKLDKFYAGLGKERAEKQKQLEGQIETQEKEETKVTFKRGEGTIVLGEEEGTSA